MVSVDLSVLPKRRTIERRVRGRASWAPECARLQQPFPSLGMPLMLRSRRHLQPQSCRAIGPVIGSIESRMPFTENGKPLRPARQCRLDLENSVVLCLDFPDLFLCGFVLSKHTHQVPVELGIEIVVRPLQRSKPVFGVMPDGHFFG